MKSKREATTTAKNQQTYKGQSRKNYGGKYQIHGQVLGCFTKKQMKSLFPGKDYERVAEYAPHSKTNTSATLDYDNTKLPLSRYGAHSRIVYKEKGSVEVGENRFVALLQKAIYARVIGLVLCLAIIAGGLAVWPSIDSDLVADTVSDEDIAFAANQTAANQLELEEGAVDWEGVEPRDTGGLTVGIAIPGYKSITIDANATDVKVNLLNPEGNPCYFVISLVLDDGTILYKSKMVEPGKGLYNITLAKALERGEYPATVKYETFSLDDLNSLNGAEVKIMLIAE